MLGETLDALGHLVGPDRAGTEHPLVDRQVRAVLRQEQIHSIAASHIHRLPPRSFVSTIGCPRWISAHIAGAHVFPNRRLAITSSI